MEDSSPLESQTHLTQLLRSRKQRRNAESVICPRPKKCTTGQLVYGNMDEKFEDVSSDGEVIVPDGRLPDVDYHHFKMKNLDEINSDRILTEFDLVVVNRSVSTGDFGIHLAVRFSEEGGQLLEDVVISQMRNTVITSGELYCEDQVIKVNEINVRSLVHAIDLLNTSSESATLLVTRPAMQFKHDVIHAGILPQDRQREQTVVGILGKGEDFKRHPSATKQASAECCHETNMCPFPQVTYTTRDRLSETMRLQQKLLELKLERLSRLQKVNLQTFDGTASPAPSCISKCDDSSLLYENGSSTPPLRNREKLLSLAKKLCSDAPELSAWVIRRRADGTRYITRKTRKQSTGGTLQKTLQQRTEEDPPSTPIYELSRSSSSKSVELCDLKNKSSSRTFSRSRESLVTGDASTTNEYSRIRGQTSLCLHKIPNRSSNVYPAQSISSLIHPESMAVLKCRKTYNFATSPLQFKRKNVEIRSQLKGSTPTTRSSTTNSRKESFKKPLLSVATM